MNRLSDEFNGLLAANVRRRKTQWNVVRLHCESEECEEKKKNRGTWPEKKFADQIASDGEISEAKCDACFHPIVRDGPVNTKVQKWQVKIAERQRAMIPLTQEVWQMKVAKLSLVDRGLYRVRCFFLSLSLSLTFYLLRFSKSTCASVSVWMYEASGAVRPCRADFGKEKSANLPCHGLLIHSSESRSSGCGQLVRQKWEKNSSNKEQWVAFLCPAPGHSAIEQWEKTNKRSLVTLTEREERETHTQAQETIENSWRYQWLQLQLVPLS